MLSSMAVIRSAAEDVRLPELGLREGREKGNHPVAQNGVEGRMSTMQRTHWLLSVRSHCLTHTLSEDMHQY